MISVAFPEGSPLFSERVGFFFLVFFFVFCGFLCCVRLRLESVLPRLTLYPVHKGCSAIALVPPPRPPPPPPPSPPQCLPILSLSLSNMCFLRQVLIGFCRSERRVSGGEVGAESNRSGFVWVCSPRRLRWGCSQRLPLALRQRTISIKL